jgi:hypothetical protein
MTPKTLALIACFFPLAIIYIVMKLSVWIAAVNSETDYVREESKKSHGPYVANPYEDVDEDDEEYGSKTDYR